MRGKWRQPPAEGSTLSRTQTQRYAANFGSGYETRDCIIYILVAGD